DHFTLTFAFGSYGNGLRVAASGGGRRVGELRDVLPRAFVEQFDRAHILQVEALQFAGFGRNHQRVSFDRLLVFFSWNLPFADGEDRAVHDALGRSDGDASALQLLQDSGPPAR